MIIEIDTSMPCSPCNPTVCAVLPEFILLGLNLPIGLHSLHMGVAFERIHSILRECHTSSISLGCLK